MPHPWEVGDQRQRWNAYLDERYPDPEAGTYVLRNKVGATSYAQLREREDQLTNARILTLHEAGIPATYDLEGLRDIHRHLFQDVYEWAGDVRTVNIAKGPFFASPDQARDRLAVVSRRIESADRFRGQDLDQVAHSLMGVYAEVNQAHPFREGNGRTQRVFVDALAAESGHGLDWEKHHGATNDAASQDARNGNLEPLHRMFRDMVHVRPELAVEPLPPQRDDRGPFLERFEEATPAQQRFLAAMSQAVDDHGTAQLRHVAALTGDSSADTISLYRQLKAGDHITSTSEPGRVQFNSPEYPTFIRAHQHLEQLSPDMITARARSQPAVGYGSPAERISAARQRTPQDPARGYRAPEESPGRRSGYQR